METIEIVGRLLIALAVVLGVIWLVAKKLRTGGTRQKLRADKLIDVLGRQSLSRTSSVAVVRVADTALVVGVTDSNVRVLHEVDLDTVRSWIAAADPAIRRQTTDGDPARVPETPADQSTDTLRQTIPHRAAGAQASPPAGSQAGSLAGPSAGPLAGPLAGSALSPATWRQTLNALRDMTARKG